MSNHNCFFLFYDVYISQHTEEELEELEATLRGDDVEDYRTLVITILLKLLI